MKTSNNEVIDPTYKGNMARFISHSCDPNCITEKWNVLGETCVGVFALRDIEKDKTKNSHLTISSIASELRSPSVFAGLLTARVLLLI